MINKSKLAFVAAVAVASIAPPAFAHTVHHHHYAHRHVYSPDAGYQANASVKPVNSDDPALTGGGSLGFNACGGHPSC
jgi:hypothetical protein